MPEPRYHGRGMQTPSDMPLHTKEQVIEAFCELTGRVSSNVFSWEHASDCFCAVGDTHGERNRFFWSHEVFDFMAEAVMAAVQTEVEVRQRIREAVLAERESNVEERDELEAQLAMTKLP